MVDFMHDSEELTIEQKLELALNPNTCDSVLEELANEEIQGLPGSFDEAYALRVNVAANPNASLALLIKLAEDSEFDVRYQVARNPSIPVEMIESFAKNSELLEAVASNLSCPASILRSLSKNREEGIRECVASNPNCPVEILEKWALLKNEGIRGVVAGNPSSPVELLNKLVSDNEPYVRMMLAANPVCPTGLLAQLADDNETEVRRAVADSKLCPIQLLIKLKQDPEKFVVSAVAGNANTPLSVLEELAMHGSGKVRLAVASNPECPETLKTIARCVPECSYPDNHQLASLMKPVVELMNLVEEARAQFSDHPFLQHPGLEDIAYASPAWNPKIFVLPTPYADRTRSMLEGPFFTNENYPWPEGGDTEFASPIVQIDLSEISRLRASDYGDGLLQVFIADSEFHIRVIPRPEVDKGILAEIPSDLEDDYSGYFTNKYWLGDGAVVSQIVGYDEPVLSASVYSSDGVPAEQDPPIFSEIFSRMESLCVNDWGTHMFGTFSPIQYSHSNFGGEVLMTLDSESCFCWGDCGSAQIFVHRNGDGSVQFLAQWSS